MELRIIAFCLVVMTFCKAIEFTAQMIAAHRNAKITEQLADAISDGKTKFISSLDEADKSFEDFLRETQKDSDKTKGDEKND